MWLVRIMCSDKTYVSKAKNEVIAYLALVWGNQDLVDY